MAVILDESGAILLDEWLSAEGIDDELGWPGPVATVAVAAPTGTVTGSLPPGATAVISGVACAFQAYTSVSAQATMEFEAGQPIQTGMITLASAPWTSMYPG